MDSFVGLFDPGSGSSSDEGGSWESDVSTSSSAKRKTQFCKNKNQYLLNDHDDDKQLPPEPQLGNIEYKLKLVNPSRLRFEHLVTQVKLFLKKKIKDI
jgi:hypothetical protein